VGPALDAACRAGSAGAADDFVVKAMVPPIFLALGILGRKLSSPGGLSGVTIAIQAATLPVAAGLGSSAALSVATAAALLQVYFTLEKSTIIDAERPAVEIDDTRFGVGSHPAESLRALINDWAFCAETLFHGNPSGLDNTVSTFVASLSFALMCLTNDGVFGGSQVWQCPQVREFPQENGFTQHDAPSAYCCDQHAGAEEHEKSGGRGSSAA
jgi:GHMP kinases N terminal domain